MAQSPDISSLAACNRKTYHRKIHLKDLYLIKADRAGFSLDGLAFSCEFVQLLSIYLECGVHRRNLLLLSKETLNHSFYFFFRNSDRLFIQNRSCHILCICLDPEVKKCLVGLALFGQKIDQPGRSAENNRKDSLRIRVQCSGMTDLFHVEDPTKFCDHIMRSVAFLFANDQNSVHYASSSQNCFSISAVRLLITSYMEPSRSQPAALV